MTGDEVKAGITVRVPRGAEAGRPARSYLFKVVTVIDVGSATAEVDGQAFTLDGKPARVDPWRCVTLYLNQISVVEAGQ